MYVYTLTIHLIQCQNSYTNAHAEPNDLADGTQYLKTEKTENDWVPNLFYL